ncbi:conserved hypothetical protein [Ricinus communis]|uniref:RNase H type-1 domain-containing protein n=1 Tax=Ricinus communis TaxID=3988 RepID=B9RF76_RICCO|nr:conserved hypothetical protein [Ricinus communis]
MRNALVFKHDAPSSVDASVGALRSCLEFKCCPSLFPEASSRSQMEDNSVGLNGWQNPPMDTLKFNVDVAFSIREGYVGIAAVVRNHDG